MTKMRPHVEKKGGYPAGDKPASQWKPLPEAAVAKPKPVEPPTSK